jgi:hypothetical protein
MAAMFRIYLCKTIHFAVGKGPANCCRNRIQVFDLIGAQSKSFQLIVLNNIVDEKNRIRFFLYGKYLLIQALYFRCSIGSNSAFSFSVSINSSIRAIPVIPIF